MPQPTKRTPENATRLVELLAGGTTKKAACAAVRISRETLDNWLKDDEEFALDVEAAVQAAVTRDVEALARASQPRSVKKTHTEFAPKKDKDGKDTGRLVKVAQTVEEWTEEGDWRAAAWRLERMDPESFGKRLDVTSKGEKIASAALLALGDVDEAEIDRRIAAAEGGEAPPDLPAPA